MIKRINLGDITSFRNGLNFSKSSEGESIRIIGVSNFGQRFEPNYEELDKITIDGQLSDDDFLKKGDIVFVRSNGNKALVGRSLYIQQDSNISFSGFCIRARIEHECLNSKYFAYFTKTDQFKKNIAKGAIGTNINNLNQGILKEVSVPIPSIEEQKKIAKVLSSLDDKIELNNQINKELEGMAKLLYDYWFVQFDFPISEEQAQEMKKPELKGKPYKSSGGKMVYNEELKREIPEGWEVKDFGSYSKVKSGFAFKSTWWTNEGVSVIKIKDIQEDYTLNQNNFSFVSEEKAKLANRFKAKKGDLVIAMTGATIGKFAMIPNSENTLLINQRVGLYDLGENPFNKIPFLLNTMKQPFFREKIFQLATGAAQPNISAEQLDSLPLINPNSKLINTYNSKLESCYEKISNNIKENQKLEELRDWLLPMLMNGQVKVQ